MDAHTAGRLAVALGLAFCLGACGSGAGWPYDDEDTGPATDGDVDTDVDIDGDSDADGGADGDADSDEREEPSGYTDEAALCFDGSEDSEAGLDDCETLECLTAARCCRDVAGSWVEGRFETCESPEACGFQPFGVGAGRAVEVLPEGWLALSGDGVGEVGALADLALDLSGSPTVTFVAALGGDDEPCSEGSCREAVGVSLTAQSVQSLASGVAPLVGLVLDGELGLVRLYVAGREDARVPVSAADLAASRRYGFRVEADGRVAFWVGHDGELGDEPDHRSAVSVEVGAEPVRLAVFGRPWGLRAARVAEVDLARRICEVPGGFTRVAGVAPFLPPDAGARAGRPAVIRRPTVDGAPLLMVFEAGSDLAVATSTDGKAWTIEAGRALPGQPLTDFGEVGRRAPTLAFWAPPGEVPTYHLWLEAVAESDASGPRAAIVHATSEDGVLWHEDVAAPVAITGSPTVAWRRAVGSPTVAVAPDGALEMFFVGRDPMTGVATLGRASSSDGETWIVDDAPVQLEGDAAPDLEGDGLADPVVLRRGDSYHLWYTVLSGSRASIAYAIGPASEGGASFVRVGRGLVAGAPWESRRVSAPAVLVTAGLLDEPEGVGSIMLWYQAGPEGREAIGLAARLVPSREVVVDFD